MKKILCLGIPFIIYAADMPPMPPVLPGVSNPANVSKKVNSNNSELPNSCQMIPPMIYKLPPPLEKLLDKCKNDLHKPSKKSIMKVFGKDITNLHVEVESEFSKIYKISFVSKKVKNVKYCNEELSYCFDTRPKKTK